MFKCKHSWRLFLLLLGVVLQVEAGHGGVGAVDLGPDVARLVGDEAAVPADVALLAGPQPHAAPAHRTLGAPGQQHRQIGRFNGD